MSLVSRIEVAAREKGLTFKALEREVGIGNGTIKRWEVQSPRLDKLILVADYLHLSLDELVGRRSETATECDGVPLSDMERDLVAMLRLLPESTQKEVFDLVHFKYSRIASGEKESIFWTYFEENNDEKSGSPGGADAREGTA